MTALQQTTAVFVMLAALQPCMQALSIVEVRKAEQGRGAGARRRLCPLPAVSKVSAADAADKDFTRALDTTESLVRALRARTQHKSALLNLETDFYDPSTGLHSEGVWHNSLIGIASLALMASGREAGQDMQEAPRPSSSGVVQTAYYRASGDDHRVAPARSVRAARHGLRVLGLGARGGPPPGPP